MPSRNQKIKNLCLTGALLLLFGVTLIAQSLPSISYSFEKQKLQTALKQLEEDFSLTFAYDNNLVDQFTIDRVQIKNASLDKALKKMLSPHNLGFEILNGEFILIKQLSPQLIPVPEEEILPSICGTVVDDNLEERLGYANVWVKGTRKGVNANEEGFFRLFGPFGQQDTLQISYLGYTTQEVPLQDLIDRKCADFKLSIKEIEFDQILIKERAIELLRSENNGTGIQFELDKMGMLPGWGDNDVLRMAQLIPGISSTNESASELHIRGGTPDQNLILWEGIPIYHTGHLFGMFSAVNPAAVDEVKIYRGGFGARYGGRVSGLIDISSTSHDEIPDSIEYGIGLNLINAYAHVKIPLFEQKSALLVAFRRSYTDLIESETYRKLFNQVSGNGKIEDHQRAAEEQDLDLNTSSIFHFSDLNIKWLFKPKENSLASVNFYRGTDALNYDVNLDIITPYHNYFFDSSDDIRLGNWGLSGNWSETWNERWKSNLLMAYTEYQHLYKVRFSGDRDLDYQAKYKQFNQMSDFKFKLDNSFKITDNQALNFGYQFTEKAVAYELTYEEREKPENRGLEKFRGEITTLYADYDYELPKKIALDFGLRYNYVGDIELSLWEPRITIDAHLSESLHFKASAGKYLQFVSQMVQYNDLGLGEEIWILANRKYSIPPLSSSQFSFGLWKDKKNFLFDLEIYSKRIKGLTSINVRFNDREEKPLSGGEANIQGLDLLLKKKWNRYSAWLSYTLASVNYTFEGLNESQPFSPIHDQVHTINWTHILSLKDWEFSLSWNFGSGRPYTNALGVETIVDGENTEYEVIYDALNDSRLPAYHRMDISMHYHWKSVDGMKGKIGLSIFNLYNQRNVFDKEFFPLSPEVQNQSVDPDLLVVDRQMLGFTPNIFLEFNW